MSKPNQTTPKEIKPKLKKKKIKYKWWHYVLGFSLILAAAGASYYGATSLKNINTATVDQGNTPNPKPEQPGNTTGLFANQQTVFLRPPYGAQFQIKNSNLAPVITAFGHLSSPGVGNLGTYFESTSSIGKEQGAQEVSEFLALPALLEYYQNLSNAKNPLVIFGGDTNIKALNFNLDAKFDPKINKVLNTLKRDYYTSLGTTGNYANPYDKFYYLKSNDYQARDQVSDPNLKFKIDLYRLFNDFSLGKGSDYRAWKESLSEANNIRANVSDHAPIYLDLNTKIKLPSFQSKVGSYPKQDGALRIGHWNILNYGAQRKSKQSDASYSKSITEYAKNNDLKIKAIATVIKQSGFDLIGLTEINNNAGQSVQLLLDELNRDGKKYGMLLQDAKESSWENTKYHDFQNNAAREQVAILYNLDLLEVIPFKTAKGNSYKESFKLYGEPYQLKSESK